MKWALWGVGGLLVVVAGVSVWFAFQRSDFVTGLVAVMAAAAFNAAVPYLTKRMPAKDEAEWRAAERRGQGENWIRRRLGSLRDR